MLRDKGYLVLMILLAVLLSACGGKQPDFAIYLLSTDMTAGEARALPLADLPLQGAPFLSMDDVVSYQPDRYELALNDAATEVVRRLAVPVTGVPFVVVAQGERVYMGAFWVYHSSLSYEGITAMMSLGEDAATLQFKLGYPESPELFEGADLRNDERILNAFSEADKLVGGR